jgi:hypothetical protein
MPSTTQALIQGALLRLDAGWSSLVARRAHNPKVVGSNPAPATNIARLLALQGPLFGLFLCPKFAEDGDEYDGW